MGSTFNSRRVGRMAIRKSRLKRWLRVAVEVLVAAVIIAAIWLLDLEEGG